MAPGPVEWEYKAAHATPLTLASVANQEAKGGWELALIDRGESWFESGGYLGLPRVRTITVDYTLILKRKARRLHGKPEGSSPTSGSFDTGQPEAVLYYKAMFFTEAKRAIQKLRPGADTSALVYTPTAVEALGGDSYRVKASASGIAFTCTGTIAEMKCTPEH
jgi:hypothetical protein